MQLIPGENEGPWTFGPSYATTRLGRHLGNDSGGGNVGCAAQQHCGEWLPTQEQSGNQPRRKIQRQIHNPAWQSGTQLVFQLVGGVLQSNMN